MLTRKRSLPQRSEEYEPRAEERRLEPPPVNNDNGMITRRRSVGRMATRSDIVVERPPNELKNSRNGNVNSDKRRVDDLLKRKERRQSENIRMPERVTAVVVEIPAEIRSRKASGENTPVQSANGSVSAASSAPKPHGINTRSRGTNILDDHAD